MVACEIFASGHTTLSQPRIDAVDVDSALRERRVCSGRRLLKKRCINNFTKQTFWMFLLANILLNKYNATHADFMLCQFCHTYYYNLELAGIQRGDI